MKSIADAVRKIFPSLDGDQKLNIKYEYSIQKGRALHGADLRRLLVSCLSCGLNFNAHYYSVFAMTINSEDTKQRVTDFLAVIKENRWQDAITYKEFDGAKDAIEATAIRCPNSEITVVSESDPQELFYNRSIIEYEVLSVESSGELNSLIRNEEWYDL